MSLSQTWIHLKNLKCTQLWLCRKKNVMQTAWRGSIFQALAFNGLPFYRSNTVKAGRQTQQRTWAPQASLHADPTATESAPPTQLFPSIGTRRAVKFKKEHLFLIGGAFKCSLKCPGRPFLVLFHNGLPAFLIVLQVQLWLRKPPSLWHFLWKTPGEAGEKAESFKCSHIFITIHLFCTS